MTGEMNGNPTSKQAGDGQDTGRIGNVQGGSKPKDTKSITKVLNLYAGIGGNRKLWDNVEVTAVENNPAIAAIYQDFFPNDTVIVGDAHQYLLDHYKEFDFIWSSPPCPTHSRLNTSFRNSQNSHLITYPDMRLYQEVIFLKHWFTGNWVVENVVAYYEPLIRPQEVNQHYFWANFHIGSMKSESRLHDAPRAEQYAFKGFDLTPYKGVDKRKLIRNCVDPKTGLYVFNAAPGRQHHTEGNNLVALDLFADTELVKSATKTNPQEMGGKDNE